MNNSALYLGAALSITACANPPQPKAEPRDKLTDQQIEACKIEKKTIFDLCSIESMKTEDGCDNLPSTFNALSIARELCQNGINRLEKKCKDVSVHEEEFSNEGYRLLHRIEKRIVDVRKDFNTVCDGHELEDQRREEANEHLLEIGLPPIEKPTKTKDGATKPSETQVGVIE